MPDSGEISFMDGSSQSLDALPYHRALRDYLLTHESDLWRWFASAKAQEEYTEHLRLELLKAAYRLDAESHPDLFRVADEARERLGLSHIPLTLYQLQHSTQLNAALYYIPNEAHVVFSGPVLSLLNTEELQSLLGHELAHYHLWQQDEGEFLIADRLLQAVANDPRASASHHQSARWFQLYTEIFADRGSLSVTREIRPVVSGLVKMQTGLAQVSAASYLKQAEEIFERSKVKTDEVSHPEAYIRARALSLWSEGRADADEQIGHIIEGAAALDDLDLLGQVRVTGLTRKLLGAFLQPKWFHTEAVLG
ncbi:MAG: Peptidase Ste24p, partial [Verrucomicrobiales bacterium]|nr:Peptidase Ste24p [Verrucomicrobiales bacterium]